MYKIAGRSRQIYKIQVRERAHKVDFQCNALGTDLQNGKLAWDCNPIEALTGVENSVLMQSSKLATMKSCQV